MPYTQETWFRLALAPNASSIACTNAGVFVGDIPLLKQRCCPHPGGGWRPRALSELNAELSDCFGLPVDFAKKMEGLSVIARALEEGNLARAQVATLNLQIPDPPDLCKTERSVQETINLAARLQMSRLLKTNWDPEQHPRWPAGSPDSVGGQFAPGGPGGGSSPNNNTFTDTKPKPVNVSVASGDAALIPTQVTIPLDPVFPPPLEPVIPRVPRLGPLPSEIMPPPIAIPNANPLRLPTNPYPDRPECEEEWASATKYCLERLRKRQMGGRRESRGIGRTVDECIRGQVTEDCGGNRIET